MGLDMYLSQVPKLEGYTLEEIIRIENSGSYPKELMPYVVKQGTPGIYEWDSLFTQIGYWRKANAIHNWFVENVQGGEDECEPHEVPKDKIEELFDLCGAVLLMREHANQDLIEDLLPTTEGFFFGGTDYDEYYYGMIEETIEILSPIITEFNWEKNYLVYQSSW